MPDRYRAMAALASWCGLRFGETGRAPPQRRQPHHTRPAHAPRRGQGRRRAHHRPQERRRHPRRRHPTAPVADPLAVHGAREPRKRRRSWSQSGPSGTSSVAGLRRGVPPSTTTGLQSLSDPGPVVGIIPAELRLRHGLGVAWPAANTTQGGWSPANAVAIAIRLLAQASRSAVWSRREHHLGALRSEDGALVGYNSQRALLVRVCPAFRRTGRSFTPMWWVDSPPP